MKISVDTSGLVGLAQRLAGQQKQIAFATAKALTQTAAALRQALPAELERVLDRPTTFTKQGTYLRAARRDDLRAEVGFKDRQAAYMRWVTEGGTRPAGARGIKLPGNIELNQFGNIPRGVIDKLKRAAQDGTLGASLRRRLQIDGNRRKGAAPVQLYLGKPTGRGWENAPLGIWRRIPGRPGKLIPVVVFENTPARYRKRLDLRRFAEPIVAREFPRLFAAALDDAIRTAS